MVYNQELTLKDKIATAIMFILIIGFFLSPIWSANLIEKLGGQPSYSHDPEKWQSDYMGGVN